MPFHHAWRESHQAPPCRCTVAVRGGRGRKPMSALPRNLCICRGSPLPPAPTRTLSRPTERTPHLSGLLPLQFSHVLLRKVTTHPGLDSLTAPLPTFAPLGPCGRPQRRIRAPRPANPVSRRGSQGTPHPPPGLIFSPTAFRRPWSK